MNKKNQKPGQSSEVRFLWVLVNRAHRKRWCLFMRLVFLHKPLSLNCAHNLSITWLLHKAKKPVARTLFLWKKSCRCKKMRNSSEIKCTICLTVFLFYFLLCRSCSTSFSPEKCFTFVSLCRWECDGKCYMMYHHRLVCGKVNKNSQEYGECEERYERMDNEGTLKVLSSLV